MVAKYMYLFHTSFVSHHLQDMMIASKDNDVCGFIIGCSFWGVLPRRNSACEFGPGRDSIILLIRLSGDLSSPPKQHPGFPPLVRWR